MEGHANELLEKGYMFPEHKSFIKKHMFPHHDVHCEFIRAEFHISECVLDKMDKNLKDKQDNTEE